MQIQVGANKSPPATLSFKTSILMSSEQTQYEKQSLCVSASRKNRKSNNRFFCFSRNSFRVFSREMSDRSIRLFPLRWFRSRRLQMGNVALQHAQHTRQLCILSHKLTPLLKLFMRISTCEKQKQGET
jgi:hypothetical protein